MVQSLNNYEMKFCIDCRSEYIISKNQEAKFQVNFNDLQT